MKPKKVILTRGHSPVTEILDFDWNFSNPLYFDSFFTKMTYLRRPQNGTLKIATVLKFIDMTDTWI